VVDQGDIDLIHKGQNVKLKFYSHPLQTIDGVISEIPNVDVTRLPPELSNMAGGEVATETDPQTGQERPIHTLYYAVVSVDNAAGTLQPSMRGTAKIEADRIALAMRLWRWLKRTFHFEA
jgi:putative peptide zinc metalloprotease protein